MLMVYCITWMFKLVYQSLCVFVLRLFYMLVLWRTDQVRDEKIRHLPWVEVPKINIIPSLYFLTVVVLSQYPDSSSLRFIMEFVMLSFYYCHDIYQEVALPTYAQNCNLWMVQKFDDTIGTLLLSPLPPSILLSFIEAMFTCSCPRK